MSKKEKLLAALDDIENGKGKLSLRATAKKYGVPYTTLNDHVSRKYTRIGAGRPTVLTAAEEEEIVYCCQVLQEIGFGMRRETVGAIIVDYLANHFMLIQYAHL